MVSLMEYLMAENLHKYVIPNDMTNVDQKCELSVQKVISKIKQLWGSILRKTGRYSGFGSVLTEFILFFIA